MTDRRLCWCIVYALLAAAVYTICIFAARGAFLMDASAGQSEIIQQPTENGLFLIEMISTKSTRFVRSGPAAPSLKVMELYELQKTNSDQVFNLRIFLKVKWNDDFRDRGSKAFKRLELLLINGIEDLFDKKFEDQNKSIAILAGEMRRVKKSGGVMIKTKVTSLEGDIEIEDIKTVIEEGAQILYEDINGKIAAETLDATGSAETMNSTETFM